MILYIYHSAVVCFILFFGFIPYDVILSVCFAPYRNLQLLYRCFFSTDFYVYSEFSVPQILCGHLQFRLSYRKNGCTQYAASSIDLVHIAVHLILPCCPMISDLYCIDIVPFIIPAGSVPFQVVSSFFFAPYHKLYSCSCS